MGRAEDLFERLELQGLQAVHAMVRDAKAEESFLDFKRSSDDGNGVVLSGTDRKNLSRALSGFSNADGGIIVWGVGTKSGGGNADFASSFHPLVDCRKFASLLDDDISRGTTPPVKGVRSIAIALADGPEGFAVTLIPSSNVGPHQATDGQQYLVRAGSSFLPIGHTVLAGMFGRRPQASVYTKYSISQVRHINQSGGELVEINLHIFLYNDTAVVARDSSLSFQARRLASHGSTVNYLPSNEMDRWQFNSPVSSRLSSVLATEANRIAPFSHQRVANFLISLRLPFTEGIDVAIYAGCEGAPPFYDSWSLPLDDLKRLGTSCLMNPPLLDYANLLDLKMGYSFLGLGDRYPENEVNAKHEA